METRKGAGAAGDYALAVDIGGTFTDVVLRRADGVVWVEKVLTTYADLLDGFFAGVDAVLGHAGITPAQVNDVVVHATTIVTNALIERKGPKTALITTAGFCDVLYIRDEYRYDMYDPQIEFPQPLVPTETTFGVSERVLADGRCKAKVDPAEVRKLADILKREGVVSVALCFLNAYVNPENERAAAAVLTEALPDLYLSLSSEVAPQMREYWRASTTVINAYTAPVVRPYLDRMAAALVLRGFPNVPMMMLSNGGVIGVSIAGRFPVRMIESGPAAGALAATYYADALNVERLLSFDMGGTTAKACIIEGSSPLVTGLFEVDRKYRFKSGSGYPVTVPSIDMIEVGAGGGSIAACGAMKLLKVGPHSAGSDPGPACYGRGGTAVCVTDADLALGLLDPDNFLGGDMPLDTDATHARLAALAQELGVAPLDAAAGIYRVVGETMASATRTHAVERGVDYRGMPLLAFGGAGPLHACYVAELMGSTTVIVPPQASVLSAFGMLVTPVRFDLVRGALGLLAGIDWAQTGRIFDQMIATGRRALTDAGVAEADIRYVFGGDLRYFGQSNEVTVTFADDLRTSRDCGYVREAFETAYEAQYGLRLPDNQPEVVNWRLTCRGPTILRAANARFAPLPGEPKGVRRVHLGNARAPNLDCAVYDRHALACGQRIEGPALIEERETTTFIPAGWSAAIDATACIMAERESATRRARKPRVAANPVPATMA
jgi:N-methylhydantoinase A